MAVAVLCRNIMRSVLPAAGRVSSTGATLHISTTRGCVVLVVGDMTCIILQSLAVFPLRCMRLQRMTMTAHAEPCGGCAECKTWHNCKLGSHVFGWLMR
jgi:hypothetical protein